ncbi:hypothetical protein ACFLX4_02900, partial [Chloroflexota bacterium]
LPNEQVFQLYTDDLSLRVTNAKNRKCIKALLERLKTYLGNYPPSAALAKSFLGQYTGHSAHTFYNYVGELRRFMQWYGDPLDLKPKLPKSLPPYYDPEVISKLLAVSQQKKTHKGCMVRDGVLLVTAIHTGLRRAELANLEAQDIHEDFLSLSRRGRTVRKDL